MNFILSCFEVHPAFSDLKSYSHVIEAIFLSYMCCHLKTNGCSRIQVSLAQQEEAQSVSPKPHQGLLTLWCNHDGLKSHKVRRPFFSAIPHITFFHLPQHPVSQQCLPLSTSHTHLFVLFVIKSTNILSLRLECLGKVMVYSICHANALKCPGS